MIHTFIQTEWYMPYPFVNNTLLIEFLPQLNFTAAMLAIGLRNIDIAEITVVY